MGALHEKAAAAAAAKSLQSCPTLCNPVEDSAPGSTVPGILQGRTLAWVAISFSMHESENEVAQSRPHGLQPTRLLRPWDFPGKSTGVGLAQRKYLTSVSQHLPDDVNNLVHTVYESDKGKAQ